jgi:hypothetical protein
VSSTRIRCPSLFQQPASLGGGLGLAIGIAVTICGGRILATQLFGVTAQDPLASGNGRGASNSRLRSRSGSCDSYRENRTHGGVKDGVEYAATVR